MAWVVLPAGTHIEAAAVYLVGEANISGAAVEADFNGVRLSAQPGGQPADVVAEYSRSMAENYARWCSSPAGKAAEKAEREEVSALQALADALARSVNELDFTDQGAVIGFLAQLQPCSDRTGVTVDSGAILQAFAANGLTPNMCLGANGEDRDLSYRWLVGQALDGLASGPAIHGIFHQFASNWLAKFAIEV